MATDELHYLELTELTRRIHAGELTSAEATEASLARIAALDGTLHSFALVLPEHALEQARTADRGRTDTRRPDQGAAARRADCREGPVLDARGPDRRRAMLRLAGVGRRRLDPLPRRHAG